jgi:hypothetical protein
LIEDAGFGDVCFSSHRYDTFSDAPSASSAAEFGTQGVDLWARKPGRVLGEDVDDERPIARGEPSPPSAHLIEPDGPEPEEHDDHDPDDVD